MNWKAFKRKSNPWRPKPPQKATISLQKNARGRSIHSSGRQRQKNRTRSRPKVHHQRKHRKRSRRRAQRYQRWRTKEEARPLEWEICRERSRILHKLAQIEFSIERGIIEVFGFYLNPSLSIHLKAEVVVSNTTLRFYFSQVYNNAFHDLTSDKSILFVAHYM
jgi:hypothetical protein